MEESDLLGYLTPRQEEVLRALVENQDLTIVARSLEITQATTEHHVRKLLEALRVHDIESLIVIARRLPPIPMPSQHARLTVRETQVVCLIANGKSNKEVGSVLGITAKTADSHRTRAMRKYGLRNTAAITRFAIRARFALNRVEPHLGSRLSEREQQVLLGIADCKTTRHIAQEMNLSIKTIESHRTRLMQKLGLHCTADLTRYVFQIGLIEQDIDLVLLELPKPTEVKSA